MTSGLRGEGKDTHVSYITGSPSQTMGRRGSSLWHCLCCVNMKTELEAEQKGEEADLPWPLASRWVGPSSWRACTVWLQPLPRLSPLTDHGRCSPSLGHSEHVAHTGGPSNFPQAPTCPCTTHLVIFNYWQQQGHVVFIYLYNLRISLWFMDYINLVCLEVSYIYTNWVCFKSFLINE